MTLLFGNDDLTTDIAFYEFCERVRKVSGQGYRELAESSAELDARLRRVKAIFGVTIEGRRMARDVAGAIEAAATNYQTAARWAITARNRFEARVSAAGGRPIESRGGMQFTEHR